MAPEVGGSSTVPTARTWAGKIIEVPTMTTIEVFREGVKTMDRKDLNSLDQQYLLPWAEHIVHRERARRKSEDVLTTTANTNFAATTTMTSTTTTTVKVTKTTVKSATVNAKAPLASTVSVSPKIPTPTAVVATSSSTSPNSSSSSMSPSPEEIFKLLLEKNTAAEFQKEVMKVDRKHLNKLDIGSLPAAWARSIVHQERVRRNKEDHVSTPVSSNDETVTLLDVSAKTTKAKGVASARGSRLDPSRVLWIGLGDISGFVTPVSLRTIFSRFGNIESTQVYHKYGFVNFESVKDAVQARYVMNGQEIYGPGSGPVQIGFGKAPVTPPTASDDPSPGQNGPLKEPESLSSPLGPTKSATGSRENGKVKAKANVNAEEAKIPEPRKAEAKKKADVILDHDIVSSSHRVSSSSGMPNDNNSDNKIDNIQSKSNDEGVSSKPFNPDEGETIDGLQFHEDLLAYVPERNLPNLANREIVYDASLPSTRNGPRIVHFDEGEISGRFDCETCTAAMNKRTRTKVGSRGWESVHIAIDFWYSFPPVSPEERSQGVMGTFLYRSRIHSQRCKDCKGYGVPSRTSMKQSYTEAALETFERCVEKRELINSDMDDALPGHHKKRLCHGCMVGRCQRGKKL